MSIVDDISLLLLFKADASQAKGEISSLRGAVREGVQGVAQDFANSAGGVGRFTASLGPAGLGVAAVTGALAAGGAAFVAWMSHAVEAGSRLHDLSLETGLSVETLSALEGQLKQSGSSAESLGNAVFFMHKNLGAAAEGNKELKRTFADLGIKDVDAALRDTDGSLRTVLSALGKLTDEGVRDRLGAEALGKAYKDLRVFIADTGGDIEETIRKAKEAGVVVSDVAANNLDELGDKVDEVHHKAEVFSTNVAGVMAPEIIKAIDDVTTAIAGIGTTWEQVGLAGAVAIARMRGAAEGMAKWWKGDTWSPWELGKQVEQGADDAELGAATDFFLNKFNPPKPKAPRGGGVSLSRGGGGGGKDKAAAERLKAIQLDEKEFDADFRRESDALERDYRRRLDTLDQFTEDELSLLGTWISGKREIFDREEKEIRRSTKNEAERETKLRDLASKRIAAEDEYERRANAARDKREEEERRAKETRADALLNVAQAVGRQRIAAIEATVALEVRRESDAAREIGDIQLASHDRATRRLKERLENEQAGSAEYRNIQGEIAVMEVERATLAEDVAARVELAKKREVEAERQRFAELRKLLSDARIDGLEIGRSEIQGSARDDVYQTRKERLSVIRVLADNEREIAEEYHAQTLRDLEEDKRINLERAKTEAERVEALKLYHEQRENEMRRHQQALGKINAQQKDDEEGQDPFHSLKDIWRDFRDESEESEDSISNSVESLSNRVAGSLHNMVGALRQAYVASLLNGEGMGKALKKALAEQLAEISAECMIQGLKHSAYALGSLAFGDFGGAARHAVAAAAFFGAAAATGYGAGKLAQSAGLQGSGSTAGQAIAASGPTEERDRTIREGRTGGSPNPGANQQAVAPSIAHVPITLTLDSHVLEQKIVHIYRSNGSFRGEVRADVLNEAPSY